MHALARRSCFCFSASGEIICVFSSIGLIIYRHSIEDIHWFRKSLMTISVVFRRSRLNAWQAYTVGIVGKRILSELFLLSLSLLVGWDQSQFPKQLSMSWSYRTAVLVIVSYEFPRCISERCLPGMVSFLHFLHQDIEDQDTWAVRGPSIFTPKLDLLSRGCLPQEYVHDERHWRIWATLSYRTACCPLTAINNIASGPKHALGSAQIDTAFRQSKPPHRAVQRRFHPI